MLLNVFFILRSVKNLYLPILVLSIFTLSIFQCNTKEKKELVPQITVSILPQKLFIEKIAGDKFQIHVMVPEGMNPETYSPSFQQMKGISQSKVYFKIGYIDFEQASIDEIKSLNPEMKVIDTSTDIPLITGGKDCEHSQHAGGVDPHIWESPRMVKIQAKNIADAFIQIDPANKDFYITNLSKFQAELDSLDTDIAGLLKNCKGGKFIIFHPALAYLARDYGLEQIAMEFDGKNPSLAHMKEIVEAAKEQKIKTIFIQKQFDTEFAQSLAKEIDAQIVQIDPLQYNWVNHIRVTAQELSKGLNK
jgi:zinc transport system substrate-binding protein